MKVTVARKTVLLVLAVASLLAAASGCGSADGDSPPIDSPAYRAYLKESAGQLVKKVEAMLPELEQGEVERAQSSFARARVSYSQIEPAAEAFPKLNTRIDARPDEMPAAELRGFHRIEKPLFAVIGLEKTAGTASAARGLIDDAKELRRRLATAEFTAGQLAASSRRILGEVSMVKLANKEQIYAESDLVNVSANLEAVGAAIDALRPALTAEERTELGGRLQTAYDSVGLHGTGVLKSDQPQSPSAGTIFIALSELSTVEIEGMQRKVNALGKAFEDLQVHLEGN